MPKTIPAARDLFADFYDQHGHLQKSPSKLSERKDALVKAMTKATIDGLSGNTYFSGSHETGSPMIKNRKEARAEISERIEELGVSKSVDASVMAQLDAQLKGSRVSKEWSLGNPINTGLVPFDLEAPAKLLTPRPTPLRNSVPRLKGQGAARRFKVVSGFTGTGTGGVGTLQPGITESTTNVGPGGLSYIRPPYISYNGYDVVLSYVSWGLSDSVSWQAEYQGQGFEDIRSLSNTALLYATMLLDERLMVYGRGTSANGYAGPLGTPTVALSAVAGSVSPQGSSSLTSGTYWVTTAADAGDLLGTNGGMHQSATTAAASVAVTAGQAIQCAFSNEPNGALGYNLFVASVQAGPYYYAGRTGYNTGFITAGPNNTAASVSAGATDASAVATNFDGYFTNLAASGGYVKRLNSTFNTTTPGIELQTMFSSLYDAVKADPDDAWFNGHDRNQFSDALLSGNNVNNYKVYIPDQSINGVRVGAVVQGIYNQITGKEVDFNVHPWFPQGNVLVRSVTLPIPDSNVSETSVMVLPQDYVAIQWPVQQFTYDASTLEIGTMAHYAPAWSGILQGIQQNG